MTEQKPDICEHVDDAYDAWREEQEDVGDYDEWNPEDDEE